MADSDVGRNKAIQARSARWRFRRVREVFAGNASSRCHSNQLIPAYVEMYITTNAARGNEVNPDKSGLTITVIRFIKQNRSFKPQSVP